jgi:hypothetical protein
MSEFCLQPDVYRTGASVNLLTLLENVWIRDRNFGEGTNYLVSGFGNYNGGVRFFSSFKRHVDLGGRVVAFFGASTSQRLTSRQLVARLLECGCEVYLINRKQIFHTKCYGTTNSGNRLIVTSGNFTSNGISHNVESALYLDYELTSLLNFQWSHLERSILNQNWEIYRPTLADLDDPAWKVIYDEHQERFKIEESQAMTMVLKLGHADTARINASPSSTAGKGSQYFWLSKDAIDFFPPLTITNERGYKMTNSCLINLHYANSELDIVDENSRVTFEAGNNVDFRLGTPKYRHTGLAQEGDLAVISRISENDYDIRTIEQNTEEYDLLSPYATTHIGHRGKRIGFLSNERLEALLRIHLPTRTQFARLPRT